MTQAEPVNERPATTPLAVLIVEDSASDANLMLRYLRQGGFEVSHERVDNAHAMQAALRERVWQVVLSDFSLPSFGAAQALALTQASGLDIPFIIVSGLIETATAIELVRSGARDYLMKNDLPRLAPSVRRELAGTQERRLRQQAEEAVHAKDREIHGILQTMQDAYFRVDLQGRFLLLSPSACQTYGYDSIDDMMAASAADLYLDQDERPRLMQELGRHGHVYDYVGQARKKDGSAFWVSMNAQENRDAQGVVQGIDGFVRDITERKAAEARILRLSQTYAALSRCNEAIILYQSEEPLFDAICKVAVDSGLLNLAWVGRVDAGSTSVVPVACFGAGEPYIRDIRISVLADDPYGQGPTGTALREGRPVWCQDYLADPTTVPWRARAQAFGWNSAAALPLHKNGRVAGVVTVYSDQLQAFDEEIRALMLEMTGNISFALDNIERRIAHDKAVEAMRASEERLRTTFEQAPLGIAVVDSLTGRIHEANPMFASITGRTREELEHTNWEGITHPDDVQADLDHMARMIDEKTDGFRIQKRYLRPDASTVWVSMSVAPLLLTGVGGRRHLCMVEDITAELRNRAELARHVEELERGRVALLGVLEDRRAAQEALQRQADELLQRNSALTRFGKVTVGRELRMVELKQEVNALLGLLGRPPQYSAVPLTADQAQPGDDVSDSGKAPDDA